MKKTVLALTSLVLVAAFAAPAQAQSLGDAARREAERRARLNEPIKVITNADVSAVPSRGGPGPAAPVLPDVLLAPPAPAPADAAPAAGPDAAAATAVTPAAATARVKRDEEHWRERARVIRERLDRLQADGAALQGRINGLNAEIDAASGSARAALADDLRQASAMLIRVQGELRLIQGEWRQFEDRAAQEQIPSAWIR